MDFEFVGESKRPINIVVADSAEHTRLMEAMEPGWLFRGLELSQRISQASGGNEVFYPRRIPINGKELGHVRNRLHKMANKNTDADSLAMAEGIDEFYTEARRQL